jgi:hypothetical protein
MARTPLNPGILPSFGIVKYPSFTIRGEPYFIMCFYESSVTFVRMGACNW